MGSTDQRAAGLRVASGGRQWTGTFRRSGGQYFFAPLPSPRSFVEIIRELLVWFARSLLRYYPRTSVPPYKNEPLRAVGLVLSQDLGRDVTVAWSVRTRRATVASGAERYVIACVYIAYALPHARHECNAFEKRQLNRRCFQHAPTISEVAR
jgi:hypothetical protein